MMRKKQGALLAAAVMLLSMSGCARIQQTSGYLDEQAAPYAWKPEHAKETTAAVPAMTTTMTTTTTTTQLTGPEFSELPLEVPYLDMQTVSFTMQAEDLELPPAFVESNELAGYTGSGYVSGLQGELNNTIVFQAEIPYSQHYDISLIACTDMGAECTLLVNDTEISSIAIEGSGKFISATAPGIYMDAGVNTISIRQESGDMYLDCMEFANNTSLIPNRYITTESCNPDASPEARRLLAFLGENYGQKMVSGQHAEDSSNGEIIRIVETTGKFPAIRFADMYPYSGNGGDSENAEVIADCLQWAEQGGIAGLMWHWYAPMGEATVFTEEADFNLYNAVTYEDVVMASPAELQEMYENGAISEECLRLIEDIDTVSLALKALCDAEVPVLWRPLHQAGGGLYWWDSAGSDVYLWLWNLLHERMVEYHQLNNLVWVWNGLDTAYLPSGAYYDIASADVYTDEKQEFGSGYEAYYALQEMAEGKILALSECSSLPDVTTAFRDGSVWSYFGLWYEPYLSGEDNEYTDSETLIAVYNSEGVLTREDYIEYCKQYGADAEETVYTPTEALNWQDGGMYYEEW